MIRCNADSQLGVLEVHAGLSVLCCSLRSYNASQLYHHFPPKHLVYRLKRQQLRQAGEHNVTSIEAYLRHCGGVGMQRFLHAMPQTP